MECFICGASLPSTSIPTGWRDKNRPTFACYRAHRFSSAGRYRLLWLRPMELVGCFEWVCTGDATAISGYIDFPSVRTSLKEQLNTALLVQKAQEQQMSAVAAGLALAIFRAIINKLVDSYVTQSSIATLLSSNKLNLEQTSQSKYVIVRLISNISPISITRWRITLNGVEIVCSFENWDWKVTDVIVPDLLTKIKRESTLE